MPLDDRIEVTLAMLEQSAREAKMFISGDGRVCEDDAAVLLAYAPKSLRQKRLEGSGPPAYRIGMNGARISYRLRDLAVWIESGRENFGSE